MLILLAFAGVAYCGESAAGRVLVALTAWGGVGAALGFASRRKPVATPAFAYLTDATMPVYIAHHVPVLLLELLLLSIGLPVWLKMTVIWLAAGAISLAAYHWLIRPWRAVSWSMGMGGSAWPMRWAPHWTLNPPRTPSRPATAQSGAMQSARVASSRG